MPKKSKPRRVVDPDLPPSCGKLAKLPMCVRLAMALRIAELGLATTSVPFRKHFRVEEALQMTRRIIAGERVSDKARKELAHPPDRWFASEGEAPFKGITYGVHEAMCAIALLDEIDDQRGRAVALAMDGAAALWSRHRHPKGPSLSDAPGRWKQADDDELGALQTPVYQAAWRAYEIACKMSEADITPDSFSGVEIETASLAPTPPPPTASKSVAKKSSRGP